ncbi:hypothetical protein EPD60_07155 [Flaviaesturariibacter flavus]|uniref:Uncharacterized protein n=1 Tax=Flaviaesturariibacter flavus TaxID=2502780 RepID=A0A4V2NWF3_9BACT|nr:hypothetical protein [Flaviaesturariibacter flavus]TCJ17082.1 hypothetical protein EPD60_07155 [Flaviaesturariibacter flavus]
MYQSFTDNELREAIRASTEEYQLLRSKGSALKWVLQVAEALTSMQGELNRRLALRSRRASSTGMS